MCSGEAAFGVRRLAGALGPIKVSCSNKKRRDAKRLAFNLAGNGSNTYGFGAAGAATAFVLCVATRSTTARAVS